MFADSLLESSPHLGHRSAWTKLASAIAQSAALLLTLAIPLFHIERLQLLPPPPSIQMTSARQPVTQHLRSASSASSISPMQPEIIQPNHIPAHILRGTRKEARVPPGPSIGSICISNCSTTGVPVGIFSAGPPVLPPPVNHARLKPLHVSEMQLGELVHKVLPEYLSIAKQLHVQGPVVLIATIGKDGRVANVQAVSGPPLLQLPAKRAVEQWQYRPYLLNHEPIVVETQITVNFVLNRD